MAWGLVFDAQATKFAKKANSRKSVVRGTSRRITQERVNRAIESDGPANPDWVLSSLNGGEFTPSDECLVRACLDPCHSEMDLQNAPILPKGAGFAGLFHAIDVCDQQIVVSSPTIIHTGPVPGLAFIYSPDVAQHSTFWSGYAIANSTANPGSLPRAIGATAVRRISSGITLSNITNKLSVGGIVYAKELHTPLRSALPTAGTSTRSSAGNHPTLLGVPTTLEQFINGTYAVFHNTVRGVYGRTRPLNGFDFHRPVDMNSYLPSDFGNETVYSDSYTCSSNRLMIQPMSAEMTNTAASVACNYGDASGTGGKSHYAHCSCLDTGESTLAFYIIPPSDDQGAYIPQTYNVKFRALAEYELTGGSALLQFVRYPDPNELLVQDIIEAMMALPPFLPGDWNDAGKVLSFFKKVFTHVGKAGRAVLRYAPVVSQIGTLLKSV
jgi:hypothetical protein